MMPRADGWPVDFILHCPLQFAAVQSAVMVLPQLTHRPPVPLAVPLVPEAAMVHGVCYDLRHAQFLGLMNTASGQPPQSPTPWVPALHTQACPRPVPGQLLIG